MRYGGARLHFPNFKLDAPSLHRSATSRRILPTPNLPSPGDSRLRVPAYRGKCASLWPRYVDLNFPCAAIYPFALRP